jgi:hypothetical protein
MHAHGAAIEGLVRSLGYVAVTFTSAEDFLGSNHVNDTSCLITDVHLPGLEWRGAASQKGSLKYVFVFSLWGAGGDLICGFFGTARQEKFAFVLFVFSMRLAGQCRGPSASAADRGQHLTQLPDWYDLGQLRYCLLAHPVLMAKPCPISMPS